MKRISILMLVLLACFVLVAWPQAVAQDKYVIQTFDPVVPPGGWLPYQGTQAPAINSLGTIAGFYSDTEFVYHSFVRTSDGTITLFDAPDAGTQSVAGFVPTALGVLGGQGTYAIAINDSGAITGFYVDIANMLHGFLRTPDGTITEFDAPGAGTGTGLGTEAANIGKDGTIAGTVYDNSGVAHGFLLPPNGKFVTFSVAGAGTGSGQGTVIEWASSLASTGAVTGNYIDAGNVIHGYVRAPLGAITTFDAPGAGTAAGQGTYSWSITNAGVVTAMFIDPNGVMHGYTRTARGVFRVFDIPGAGRVSGQGTIPEGINAHGAVIGNFINTYGENRGFRRTWGGSVKRFSVPAAGTGSGQGTVPLTDNASGMTTGSYFDNNFGLHGFVITF
ncbi:MAG: hypothetical protein WAK13_16220 [Terriglobales bacterium]